MSFKKLSNNKKKGNRIIIIFAQQNIMKRLIINHINTLPGIMHLNAKNV